MVSTGCNWWSSNPISGLTFCLFWRHYKWQTISTTNHHCHWNISFSSFIFSPVYVWLIFSGCICDILVAERVVRKRDVVGQTLLFPGKGWKFSTCCDLRRNCYQNWHIYANMNPTQVFVEMWVILIWKKLPRPDIAYLSNQWLWHLVRPRAGGGGVNIKCKQLPVAVNVDTKPYQTRENQNKPEKLREPWKCELWTVGCVILCMK